MARILVIDDNEDFLIMFCKMLKAAGHETVPASNGQEGIDLYRKEPTELIITDIIMPKKDGVEMIEEILRDFPEAKIIAISGGGRGKAEDYLTKTSSFPKVKHTLSKPFDMKEILQAIKEVLNK